DLAVGDDHVPFRRYAEDGLLVELAAIRRVVERAAIVGLARDTEAKEQADKGLVGRERRAAAPVVKVAGGAGPCVEDRPQPIAAGGRRRRRDPAAIEERVADEEISALIEWQVARRLTEGIAGDVEHCRRGARH